MHLSMSTYIENALKRICGTIFIALYAATLHRLMSGSGAFLSIPLNIFIGGIFSSIIRSTVQVSLFNKSIKANTKTRLDCSCISNLQSMGENLDTSLVLYRFYLQLCVWYHVVLPSEWSQDCRGHKAGSRV